MATVFEETVTIKLSRLTKSTVPLTPVATAEFVSTIETVVQELVGVGVIVEVNKE